MNPGRASSIFNTFTNARVNRKTCAIEQFMVLLKYEIVVEKYPICFSNAAVCSSTHPLSHGPKPTSVVFR